MNDDSERTCPLCAEEMDLTDRQLKPCKCGYEICVWCWHHILDMAEKDDTEGRCPACRTPYDKEKIVGTAANCERMVAEISSERKLKSQKAKPKASEGRKHLSSVRVMQRNLVYVTGIPTSLADENTLERKEYFGQYGKVLKVSITKPNGGGQNSSSNTVNVYITYSKEEEAVRCIQSVHGFSLDGKSLRACFGTTKYCHAWLRNMPCSNPDCLYLHEVGVQDDSFTKDEIISAYTRNRVQRITGASNNNYQRRSGNILPPPTDDFCISVTASSTKPNVKSMSTNPTDQVKVSPPNSSAGRSSALPAAASWGLRASNSQPSAFSTPGSQAPFKQTVGMLPPPSLPLPAGLALDRALPPNPQAEIGKTDEVSETFNAMLTSSCKSGYLENCKQSSGQESQTVSDTSTEKFSDSMFPTVISDDKSFIAPIDKARSRSILQGIGTSNNQPVSEKTAVLDEVSSGPLGDSGGIGWNHDDSSLTTTSSSMQLEAVTVSGNDLVSGQTISWCSDSQASVLPAVTRADDNVLSGVSSYLHCSTGQHLPPHRVFNGNHPGLMDEKVEDGLNALSKGVAVLSNRHRESEFSSVSKQGSVVGSSGPSNLFSNRETDGLIERVDGDGSGMDRNVESSIISSILSLDLDSWDDPFTSSNKLAKILNESHLQNGSIRLPSSWKQKNSQSRFSFAREEFNEQASNLDPLGDCSTSEQERCYVQQNSCVSSSSTEELQNGMTANCHKEFDHIFNSHSVLSSNRVPVSKSQMVAPPGFSAPSRAPPPGFSSRERLYRALDSTPSGNPPLESYLSRNIHQVPNGSSGSVGDLELIDPAILAVGKGTTQLGMNNSGVDLFSGGPNSWNSSDTNLMKLQLLLQQQSLSTHQNYRYSDHMDERYSALNDGYISSRLLGQAEENSLAHFTQMSLQQARNSQFTSSQLGSWNEVHRNELGGIAEFLRNERLGINKYFPGHEELKVHIPTSADVYNRAFGM